MGGWDEAHGTLTDPVLYGYRSYPRAAGLLSRCAVVEDWGCGGGGFRQFRTSGYRGVDSSETPWADVTADLVSYRSDVDGILLRHVLEHSHGWARILDNALASFRQRLVVILFTPLVDVTRSIRVEVDYDDAPVYSFRLADLTDRVDAAGLRYRTWTVESDDTFYETETFLVVDR